MTMLHKHTGQCGYDRNASHSAGHYVCACGFEDETCVRSERGITQDQRAAADASGGGILPPVKPENSGTQTAAHPLPTPRTDEACKENGAPTSLVYADFARTLERENAELRAQLAEKDTSIAFWKADAIAGNTKLAEAERQHDEARKDAERYQWVLPILTGEGHEGDKRALAIAAQLVNGLTGSAAIDAAKEVKT